MIILNPGGPGDGGEPGGGDEELHESRLQGRHRDLEHPPTRGQLGGKISYFNPVCCQLCGGVEGFLFAK